MADGLSIERICSGYAVAMERSMERSMELQRAPFLLQTLVLVVFSNIHTCACQVSHLGTQSRGIGKTQPLCGTALSVEWSLLSIHSALSRPVLVLRDHLEPLVHWRTYAESGHETCNAIVTIHEEKTLPCVDCQASWGQTGHSRLCPIAIIAADPISKHLVIAIDAEGVRPWQQTAQKRHAD